MKRKIVNIDFVVGGLSGIMELLNKNPKWRVIFGQTKIRTLTIPECPVNFAVFEIDDDNEKFNE